MPHKRGIALFIKGTYKTSNHEPYTAFHNDCSLDSIRWHNHGSDKVDFAAQLQQTEGRDL